MIQLQLGLESGKINKSKVEGKKILWIMGKYFQSPVKNQNDGLWEV